MMIDCVTLALIDMASCVGLNRADLTAGIQYIDLTTEIGGILGTVVARLITGQQVKRSILHQGHDS